MGVFLGNLLYLLFIGWLCIVIPPVGAVLLLIRIWNAIHED